jgi:hypothetical protein
MVTPSAPNPGEAKILADLQVIQSKNVASGDPEAQARVHAGVEVLRYRFAAVVQALIGHSLTIARKADPMLPTDDEISRSHLLGHSDRFHAWIGSTPILMTRQAREAELQGWLAQHPNALPVLRDQVDQAVLEMAKNVVPQTPSPDLQKMADAVKVAVLQTEVILDATH